MRARRGFTLVEVLTAVGLIAIGLLGLVGVRLYALRVASEAPHQQTASLIAETQLTQAEEKLRQGQSLNQVRVAATRHAQHPLFEYEVQAALDSTLSNLVLLDVEVRWQDQGRERLFRLHSRFTEL